MDLLAPIVRWVIAPAWARYERSPYLRHYRTVLKTQYDSAETIQSRQLQRLSELVSHACDTSPFWRKRLGDARLQSKVSLSFADLRELQVLTKADLQGHADQMLSSAFPKSALREKRTSGSTGTPVSVYVHDERQQWTRACALRADEWSGWRLGERVATIWGNCGYLKRGWRARLRNALLDRNTNLDTLKMDQDAMQRFAEQLQRRPPSLLFGHAHSLYLFAQFLQATGDAAFRPRGIIATAMVLHQHERELIEDVFDCPVTDRYGCEEVGMIACQCERHEGLHVISDCVYLEILRPDGLPTEPGELGRVIVTDLVNNAMPMIRYEVGDMAAWSGRPCSCGRGLPSLERVEGRVADYVVTPRGELISGISLTENFAVMVPGLAQLQIVQEEVDRFLFRIVRGSDFGPASLETIGRLVAERFGPEVRYQCEFVDRIPQEPSGKYRFCISKVKSPYHVD